ncbi:MAG: hypothetical protein RXN88_03445 [Acidilobus sp.]|jgi:hypothetical protein
MDWETLERMMVKAPYHVDYIVPKDSMPSPEKACLEPSIGKYRGQLRNWRATLSDSSCLHVLEFKNIYVVHRDRANLNDSVVKHIALDEPRMIVLTFWLPLLELARVLFRVMWRKRMRARGSRCY